MALATDVKQHRSLAFVDPTTERLYVAESVKESGAVARGFLTIVAAIFGLLSPLFFFAGWAVGASVACGLACVISASARLLIAKTETGRRHQPQLIAISVLVLFGLLVGFYANELFRMSPGQLREPVSGEAIPECTTVAIGGTLHHPSDVNFTSSPAFDAYNSYKSQVCFFVNSEGEQRVMELRNWAAKDYDFWAYEQAFFISIAVWSIWGLGAVLLLSMRFVDAARGVALPGLVLWCVWSVTTSALPEVIAIYTLLLFVPAFVTILGVSWKLECAKRALFLERLKVKRLLKKKDQSIEKGENKVFEMEQQLNDARKTVDRVMAAESAALRPFELFYSEIEWEECDGEKKQLGEGSFGTVYKATLRGEHDVAVKTMRVSKISERELIKFKSEIIIMSPLHHPNLVRLWGGVWNEGADRLCIVLEYVSRGSLIDILKPEAEVAWGTRFALAFGVAKCFHYLHHELTKPLMHRDLKPANVLVSDNMDPKVADFGESKLWEQGQGISSEGGGTVERQLLTQTLVGTAAYMAPEIVNGQRYNKSVDVFSFSLVLLEISLGDAKFISKHFRDRMLYINGNRPPIPQHLTEERQ